MFEPIEVRRRLLIIEPDAAVASELRRALVHPLLDVEVARTDEGALMKARAMRPHAILLDVNLPARSGSEILEALQRDPELRFVRIILGAEDLAQSEAVRRRVLRVLSLDEVPAGRQPLETPSSHGSRAPGRDPEALRGYP
jgi:ActR/RegA family two-component response regulator